MKMPPHLYIGLNCIYSLEPKAIPCAKTRGSHRAEWLKPSHIRKEGPGTGCSQRMTVQAMFSVVSKLVTSSQNSFAAMKGTRASGLSKHLLLLSLCLSFLLHFTKAGMWFPLICLLYSSGNLYLVNTYSVLFKSFISKRRTCFSKASILHVCMRYVNIYD